jgi:hypothetical protein
MPQPFDYSSSLGGSEGITPAVQSAVFGGQRIQANQAQLDEQARADAARRAAATIATTPNLDNAQFEKLLLPIAQADPGAAAAMRRQREVGAQLQQVLASPTAANIARFGMAYPDQLDPIKKGWDMLDAAQRDAVMKTNADVYSLLSSGDTEGAKAVLQAHEDADKAAGLDTSAYSQLHDLIDRSPEGARALAGMSLATAMGHEKFADAYKAVGEERRAEETQPAAVRKAEAEADTAETTAQFAPAKAESDLADAQAERERKAAQTANEIVATRIAQGRLELDRDTLETNTQLKLQELAQTGTTPDAGSAKIMNDAAGEAVDSQASAAKLTDLAERFRSAGLHASGTAITAEAWRRLTGSQNGYTLIRNEYLQIRNSEALKGRKNMPGQMSDADREFLLQGFPSTNASASYIAHFLETMAQAQQINAKLQDRKASWISANGNLGTAKRDLDVGGVQVPRGTTFAQFMGQAGVSDNRGQLPSGISTLMDRYGH